MIWADVGAIAVGFLVFTGVGASASWLAARASARRREHGSIDWLDVLDAFEGTPPAALGHTATFPSFPPPQPIFRSSTSKTRVEFGGMTGGKPRSP